MRKGASVCGLNGFHSRNEMTNLSEHEPPFLWGIRLLDLDRYLLNKQDSLFLKKELMSINTLKKESPDCSGT